MYNKLYNLGEGITWIFFLYLVATSLDSKYFWFTLWTLGITTGWICLELLEIWRKEKLERDESVAQS